MTTREPALAVVHVFGTLDRGGAETVALNLCRTISASEVRQTFVLLGDREGRLAGQFRAEGAAVQRCPVQPLPTFVPRLWRCLRTLRPHAVVSHVSVVSGLVLAVAAAARVPVRIAHMHSEGDGRSDSVRRTLQRDVLRALLRRCATRVVGVTSAALAFAAPSDGDVRYTVLPNGVDVARFARRRCERPNCEAGPRLAHVGRAAPEKNRGFLVLIHVEARRLRDGATLTIVGPGGSADLTAMDPDITRDQTVRLVGETDHVEDVLAQCDVLLLPSRREGLPGVVLQALVAGVPVLASDLPGLRELTGTLDGITLLPLDAGPAAWARTAIRLADMPQGRREEISHRVRDSHFTLERYAAAWRALWASP